MITAFPDRQIADDGKVVDVKLGQGLSRFKAWVDTKIDDLKNPSKLKGKTQKERQLQAIEEVLEEEDDDDSGSKADSQFKFQPVKKAEADKLRDLEKRYKDEHKNYRYQWEFPAEFPD